MRKSNQNKRDSKLVFEKKSTYSSYGAKDLIQIGTKSQFSRKLGSILRRLPLDLMKETSIQHANMNTIRTVTTAVRIPVLSIRLNTMKNRGKIKYMRMMQTPRNHRYWATVLPNCRPRKIGILKQKLINCKKNEPVNKSLPHKRQRIKDQNSKKVKEEVDQSSL